MDAENTTPEWFQMAQADGYGPRRKKNRGLRVAVLTAPLFVLGAGLVFAQTQDGSTALASAANPVSALATAFPSATAQNGVQVSQTSPATTASASITLKKPGIAKPTGDGDDSGLPGGDND